MVPPETDAHDEHYESIPWDALVTADAGRRRRLIYLASAAVVVAGLAAAVTISLVRDREPAPSGTPATTLATALAPETTAAAPLSESDLRPAVLSEPLGAADAAIAHALWFAADYFTADGSEVTAGAVADRLPADLVGVDQSSAVRSFVESVIPIEVEDLGDDRYRVVVVVRYLASPDGSEYRRPPAVALEMVVEVTPDGPALIDLPAPIPVPAPATAGEPDVEQGAVPADVLDAARTQAAVWGEPSETVVSSGRVADGWRVQLTVVTPEGLELPVAVWIDAGGNPTPAGAPTS